ncbi:SDR family NAD(P)-dependent oxidoreductase [Curvibacter sp. HBC61]|uniref:SDR family NAD(P)-dependent oxidoreductase n=1 Tax=Curvibacter cyanobacteriorum TaxID=3026422 RepID=A0ABT5MU01_9BURK|nr:SDR family NAD(P)-dependent oxidoreductase [Curvibacter sp. HBC61]MDD0837317.1 SDR family NAD(P)-dependent oxidoreductase [Curvibacter sp. HBC61]
MTTSLYIITGASRGMGLAMAQQLLQPGNTLLTLSRQPNPVLDTAATAQGIPLIQWAMDLADGNAVAHELGLWLTTLDPRQFDRAVLINNAGVIPPIAPLSATPAVDVAWALRVGLEAPMQLSASFLNTTEGWRAKRQILNISSGLGRRPMASQASYCAAKAGLDHFSRCVALDEAQKPNGAQICSLAPGVIDTDMQAQLRGTSVEAFPDQGNFAALKANGQLTSADEAARRVLAWLDRADFGQNPVADVRDA